MKSGKIFFRRLLPIMLVAMAACAQVAERPARDGGLTFFHLNDTYRIGAVAGGTAGGFGRVVTLIREAERQGRDVRILHGGDFLYPSLESQLWNGEHMVEALNFMDKLAPMYVVAGNHEFDRRTPRYLIDAVRASRFDWLGDNYAFATGDSGVDAALHRGFLFDYGGRRVGIFALTLHPDDGGNARNYVPTQRDYLAVAEQAIERLEEQGADLVIGLTHLHASIDAQLAELKAAHPRFLFITGGHEHEPVFFQATPMKAAVMKGASNARAIWRIDVDFPGPGGRPVIAEAKLVEVDARIASDAEYDVLERKWRARLLETFPFLEAAVGRAALPLDGREHVIRNEETNWGNFVADRMRGAFGDPPADLAFINSGTLRIDDVIQGDILFEDIGRTFGFSSFLRYLAMSGREFRDLLEAGYRGSGPSKGYFPQVSGFRICVDRSLPEGSRIVSLQVPAGSTWREIDEAADYLVVVPDYLYGGGDGYEFPAHREASRPGSELKYLVLDAIMAAQAAGRRIGEPVDPDAPRIVIKSAPGEACFP